MAKHVMQQAWKQEYQRYKGRYCIVFPSLPSKNTTTIMDRRRASVLYRLRSSQNNTRRHLTRKRMVMAGTPVCRLCTQEMVEEESEHHLANHYGKWLPLDYPECLRRPSRSDVKG